jgi:hypothetical protein
MLWAYLTKFLSIYRIKLRKAVVFEFKQRIQFRVEIVYPVDEKYDTASTAILALIDVVCVVSS